MVDKLNSVNEQDHTVYTRLKKNSSYVVTGLN